MLEFWTYFYAIGMLFLLMNIIKGIMYPNVNNDKLRQMSSSQVIFAYMVYLHVWPIMYIRILMK